jgi:hypothetical protein
VSTFNWRAETSASPSASTLQGTIVRTCVQSVPTSEPAV